MTGISRLENGLLMTPKGWKKLTTEAEIDQYVQRKLPGTLFVFNGISRKGERQVMTGTLYSPSRHESQPVEFVLQVGGSKPSTSKEEREKEKDKGKAKTKEKESVEILEAGMRPVTQSKEGARATVSPQK